MKYLLALFLLLGSTCNSEAVELLICAKNSPFDTGCKIGDILVVRPDGHVWGTAETLPDYLVIKVPGVTYEAAKKYEDSLLDNTEQQNMVRLRKWQVPLAYMTKAISDGVSPIVITLSAKKLQFINSIVEKTQ